MNIKTSILWGILSFAIGLVFLISLTASITWVKNTSILLLIVVLVSLVAYKLKKLSEEFSNKIEVSGIVEIGLRPDGTAWFIPPFCKIREPHTHYRLDITFHSIFGENKYNLKIEYCPIAKKIHQIEPKPVIVDHLIYDKKEYEEKSSNWGE